MNLISIKRTDDLKLEGIKIDAEWRDKALAALTLTDAKGNIVRIATENYTVRAYVTAPVEKKMVYVVKKMVYVVTGIVPTLGTPIREEHENDFEAQNRKRELEHAGVIENAATAVEEIEIPF